MGQILKQFFLSYWFLVALLFSTIFLGVKNSKILRGSGSPKVKLDPKTGVFVPDDAWRTWLAWILGLGAAFGIPLLTKTGGATLNVLGWVAGIVFGAVLVDQGFAKMRDGWIPKIKKWYREKLTNKGRKS